jgi:Methyltransferase domain
VSIPCPICDAASHLAHEYRVLSNRTARLFECSSCGFGFVADPAWLAESFTSQLSRMDVGSADRSLLVAQFVRGLLTGSRKRRKWKVLDFGGGDGLLTRVLRDSGVDCRWQDPYCSPVYMVGPSHDTVPRFDLVVMSEVALHLTEPAATFGSLLDRADRVLFTAVVPPSPIPADWWYLMPTTGQHVAFYPNDSVAALARRLRASAHSDGRFFHLLSRSRVERDLAFRVQHTPVTMLLAEAGSVAGLVGRARGTRRSLTESDQAAVAAEFAAERSEPRDV